MKRSHLIICLLFICSAFVSAQTVYQITDVEVGKLQEDGDYKILAEWAKWSGYVILEDKSVKLKDGDFDLLKLIRTSEFVPDSGLIEDGVSFKAKNAMYYHDDLGDFQISHVEYSDGEVMFVFYYASQRKRFMVKPV